MIRLHLTLFVLAICLKLNVAQKLNDEIRLQKYLFSANENGTAYNPNLRPVISISQRVVVNVRLGIKRLYEMVFLFDISYETLH
jgi:hypothetical protein